MSLTLLIHNVQPTSFFKPLSPPLLTPRCRRLKSSPQRPLFRASASGSPNGSDGLSWERVMDSIRSGSCRFLTKFGEDVKKETGIDFEDTQKRISGLSGWVQDAAKECEDGFNFFRFELVPEFISWSKWENWKDIKSWEPKRISALVLYTIAIIVSCRKIYAAIQAPRVAREKKELMEAYMEALIPEPTPSNIRKLKKGMWRKTMPKGLKIKKFVEGSNRTMIYDSTYIGEDAWEDDIEHPLENTKGIIDGDASLTADAKKAVKKEFGISAPDQELKGSWRDRLQAWSEVMEKEKLSEQLSALNARYAVEFDMKEVEESLRKDLAEKASAADGARALWISKRWWRYRPRLPYTYFLEKLDSSEVAAVVFTEDLKRLYVTMKEGFPLEYIVDIPLDPFLFETISNSGVEVDLLQKQQIHYLLKAVIALLPGILILWFMRESLMLLHIASSRFLYKKYRQFFDMAYAENFVLPVGEEGGIESMSREVVLGGDVWDLLEEIMIYLRNPMQYYEREVQFVRGILLFGPPGTGKTLFARSLSNKGGLPFVFASGAEFTDSEKSGAAKINEMFSIARRNAPSFVFIDEIDALAGRHCRSDPRRRAAFEALISQLDGEKVKTGVDRCSLRQAVIFLCATNRPDELDKDFVRAGRIDRRVYVGLPDAKQRVQIFGLHSAGMQLAEDVDFGKLVFRTVGYSGADIRSLVNEAGIMSVRKGHSKIFQQDIIDVLDKQLLEGMGVLLTEEEQQKCEKTVSLEKRRLLAVHEAGHVVLAHLFPRFDWHAFSQLLPGGKETAVSVFYPREEMINKGYTTLGYMMMQMVVAHGGRCAERVVFGDDVTDGGKDDLEKITKIAREMVINPGNARLGLTVLTKRIGLKARRGGQDGELIRYEWDDPHVTLAEMTPEISELFTRELTRYIEETEDLAIKGLEQNRHILDEISKELLEKSRITGLEVQEQMKRLSPIMFEDFAKPFQIDLNQEDPLPHNDRLRYQPLDIYPAPLHRC